MSALGSLFSAIVNLFFSFIIAIKLLIIALVNVYSKGTMGIHIVDFSCVATNSVWFVYQALFPFNVCKVEP